MGVDSTVGSVDAGTQIFAKIFDFSSQGEAHGQHYPRREKLLYAHPASPIWDDNNDYLSGFENCTFVQNGRGGRDVSTSFSCGEAA